MPVHRMAPLSELEFHAQSALNHARPAAYHARSRANGRGRGAAYGCGDFAEVAAALVENRVVKIRVVEKVEEVRAEAQMDSFCTQREDLGDGKIPILEAGAVVLIASGSAHASSGGNRCRTVKFGNRNASEIR